MDENLKIALECCGRVNCCVCPMLLDGNCMENLSVEVKRYIDGLEERIATMQESMDALKQRYEPNIMPLTNVMEWMGKSNELREPIYWENRFEKCENQWLLKPENPLYMINAIKAGHARAWTQKPTEEQLKAVKWE